MVLSNTEHVASAYPRGELFKLLLQDIEVKDAPPVPKVAGAGPKQVVLGLIKEMAEGKVDRTKLGEEDRDYLADERVKAGGVRRKALGEP